ncbi:apelin receptor B-like [Scyliorhinus canicula]|uniref:apelin receptor B-like n=1 Tax=Scyliorhinus canicula TaxID=7830 RepID=UPI0018F72060|nr:apelin receptor B-like [Scyliorhinus canicula]
MESYYYQMIGNDSDIFHNDTECPIWEWEPSYVLIPCIYVLVFVLGLSGNGTVLWASWHSRGKRKSADAFIAHLALADLTFVLTLPLWAVYTAQGYHWSFGIFLCKLSSYVVLLNMYSSVFCLTCLSVDRYQAIVRSPPGSAGPGRGPRKRGLWLAAVWALAGVLALPALVFRRAIEVPGGEEGGWAGGQTVCDMDLSPLGQDEEVQDLWLAAFGLSSTAIGFVLPFAIMASCYGLIGGTLSNHFQKRERDRRRRLLSVIFTLVLAFGLCWLPFHLVKTLATLDGLGLLSLPCPLHTLAYISHPYTTCLAYVNSCLNPLLYAWLDPDFRQRCRRVLTCRHPPSGQGGGGPSPEPSATPSSNNTRCEVQSFKA